MTFLSEGESVLEYCQRNGLRILAGDAFQYFMEHLGKRRGNYLEIGVFEGYMLRELAQTFPDKMFYGVDPFIEDGHTTGHNGVPKGETTHVQKAKTWENISEHKNIRLFEQTSRSFFEDVTDEDLWKLDLTHIFVDGNHSYEEARNDMFNSVRAFINGGWMFIDDIGLPGVTEAAMEVAEHYRDRLIDCSPGDGLLKFKPL